MIGKKARRPTAAATLLATALVACGGGAATPGSHGTSRVGSTAEASPSGLPGGGPAPVGATTNRGGHSPIQQHPNGAAPQPVGGQAPSAIAQPPPAGHYVYDASGCTSCDTVGYRAAPPSVTSDVSDQGSGASVTSVTTTVVDSSNSSSSTLAISPTDAHEVHLTTHGEVGPVAYAADLTPQPPFLVAPLPFQPGQSWQFSWQDSSNGTTANGSGQTVDQETVSTALGAVNTYLVQVKLQIQSSQYTATTTYSVWIDPRTHATVKWRDQRTIHSPAGSGTYDVTAVLSSGPAA